MKYHLPCSDCLSSDALAVYEDHTFCFSCRRRRKLFIDPLDKEVDVDYITLSKDTSSFLPEATIPREVSLLDYKLKNNSKLSTVTKDTLLKEISYEREYTKMNPIKVDTPKVYRGLLKSSLDFYKVEFYSDRVVYPSPKGSKVRFLNEKKFYTEGDLKESPLFGKDLIQGRWITITEGENDTIAVFQMQGSKYPVVSVRSSSTAKLDCQTEFNYLNSFERIYLCFDSDKPGQEAVSKVASLFNPNKVYHVKLHNHKDAHEYLEADHQELFIKEWWNARPYLPSGIIGDYKSIEEILDKESNTSIATYPFPKVQEMTYGIRSKELNLFTAQEKVGKTEIMRALEYHLLTTTDYPIGIIHLEEEEKRTIQGLVTYSLKTPVHLPDSVVSNKEILDAYRKITKRDSRCFLYKHFGSDDPQVILDTIRYLVVVCGCKFIFLDHITMLVTGFTNEDERKTLDHLSTHLAMMTRELDFTLFLVSHVNDDGKTRGSRNIAKVADLIVSLYRDIESEFAEERNKTFLTIKGNRFAGVSGPSSVLLFDPKTFTYSELMDDTSQRQEHLSTTEFKKTEEDAGRDSGSATLWAEASREGGNKGQSS